MLISSDAKIADCSDEILQNRNTVFLAKLHSFFRNHAMLLFYINKDHIHHIYIETIYVVECCYCSRNEAQGVHNNYHLDLRATSRRASTISRKIVVYPVEFCSHFLPLNILCTPVPTFVPKAYLRRGFIYLLLSALPHELRH